MGVERVARRRRANATASTTDSGVDGRNLILTTAPQGLRDHVGDATSERASWFRRIFQARIRYSDMERAVLSKVPRCRHFVVVGGRRECWRSDNGESERSFDSASASDGRYKEEDNSSERADGAKSTRAPAVQTATRGSGDARELTIEGGGPRCTMYQEERRRRPRCRLPRLLRRQREREGTWWMQCREGAPLRNLRYAQMPRGGCGGWGLGS